MPDLYRRADLARWHTLLNLPLAAVSLIVILATGTSVDVFELVVFVLAVVFTSLLMAHRVARKQPQAESRGTPAPATAARAKAIRTNLLSLVPSAACFTALASVDGNWWLLPGAYFVTTATNAIEWRAVTIWERAHPGAYLVSDSSHWRPQRFVLRPQS
jgi:hypothetical protein